MLQKDAIVTYTPARAEVQAVPAHTVCSDSITSETRAVETCEEVLWSYEDAEGKVTQVYKGALPIGSSGSLTVTGPYPKTTTIDGAAVTGSYYRICYYSYTVATGPKTTTCINYPAVAYQPARPASLSFASDYGWNAGANSVDSQAGDCELVWAMEQAVGVVIGLTSDRVDVTDFGRITHGWLFDTDNAGAPRARVVESGQLLGAAYWYDATTLFKVMRIAGVVTYWRGTELLRTSTYPSLGEVWAGCALYASGDAIP